MVRKNIIIFALIVFMLPAIAYALDLPFNQCIRVLDAYTGQPVTGLDCTFSDETGTYNSSIMSDNGGGFYCIEINGTYDNTTYLFTSTCTDGNLNTTISGTFTVGAENTTVTEVYQVNECPTDSTPKAMLFIAMILIGIILVIVGLLARVNFLSGFGGILLIVSYFQLMNCNAFWGGIFAIIGALSFLYSTFNEIGLFGHKNG